MKQGRTRLSYANVMSSLAVFLVLGGGAAFAASHLARNSVGRVQLRRGAVTTAKIRNNAVTAAKIRSGAITGAKIHSGAVTGEKIDLRSLGTVPQAATFSGYSRAGTVRAPASADAGSFSASLAAAPAVPLISGGPFAVYGKCFDSGGLTRGVILISTTQDGSIFQSGEDELSGPVPAAFLNTSTPEAERELIEASTIPDSSEYQGSEATAFAAMAPKGAAIRGDGQIGVKGGTVPAGESLFGPGDVCLFAAEMTIMGG
jgi:hypothetical protein